MRYKAGYQTEDGLKVITYRYYNNPDSAWKVLKRKAKREGFDTSRLREMPNKYIENSSNVGIRQENLNEPRGPIDLSY